MVAIDMAVAIIKVHLHGGLMSLNLFFLPPGMFCYFPDAGFDPAHGWLGLDDFVGRGKGARTKVMGR